MQRGMEKGPAHTHGVISVFVSRFDRALDETLRQKGLEIGMTGIYNAAAVYNLIERANEPRIRTLFASTGVKGDDLPPAYYVAKLKAPHAVNTAPLATIEAYETAENEPSAMPYDDAECEAYFSRLKEVGIDIDEVRKKLLEDGLVAFEKAFTDMLGSLA